MRLNLGSGEKPLPGWINLDAKGGNEIYPLPFPDNSAEEIRASHVIEHFGRDETEAVLKEWARVLKPGGWLKIAVPDFGILAPAIVERADYSTQDAANASLEAEAVLFGGQTDALDFHKALFSEAKLAALLKAAGLEEIQRWSSDAGDCAARPFSLNLEGRKPQPARIQIAAVMSVPRVGYLDTMGCVLDALTQCRAPLFTAHGVFWSHAMTRGIERALEWEGEADYILTVDYDSIFAFQDVAKMVCLMADNPDADILVPMQMKRGGGELLAGTQGPVDLTQPLVPIKQGHFGMTLLRRSVFAKLEKPWFLERPDPRGGWDEGRTDPDIYFWANAERSNVKAFLATRVMLGHGEEVVSWPRWDGEKFVAHYQPATEWHKTGRPPQF